MHVQYNYAFNIFSLEHITLWHNISIMYNIIVPPCGTHLCKCPRNKRQSTLYCHSSISQMSCAVKHWFGVSVPVPRSPSNYLHDTGKLPGLNMHAFNHCQHLTFSEYKTASQITSFLDDVTSRFRSCTLEVVYAVWLFNDVLSSFITLPCFWGEDGLRVGGTLIFWEIILIPNHIYAHIYFN